MDDNGQSPDSPVDFQYSRLDRNSVRLFSFVEASQDDAASGSFSVHLKDLPLLPDAQPIFVAISYVCGDLKDKVPINVNGSTLKIYRTLFRALEDLRPLLETSLVWADAICIDQNDQGDKENQVAAIGDLYRIASRVLVYSGRADGSSNLLFENFPSLLTHVAKAAADGPPYTMSEGFFEKHSLPLPTDPIWRALAEFYRREWSQRLWIVQEVALAKTITIYCGDKPFQWTDLLELEEHMRKLELWAFFPRDPAFLKLPWFLITECEDRRSGRYKTLLGTLVAAGTHQCHNPLDRIYALRCMFPDPVRELIPVSYDSDLQANPHRLYVRVGHAALTVHHDLLPLALTRTEEMLPQLPSWCKNWQSTSEYINTLDDYPHAGGTLPPAAPPPHIASSSDQRRLYLQGLRVSTITTIAQKRYPLLGLGPSRWLQNSIATSTWDWLNECINLVPNGRDPAQQIALYRALTFGDVRDPRWPHTPIPDLDLYKIFSILIDYLQYAKAWARADDTPGSSGLFKEVSAREMLEMTVGQLHHLTVGALRALDERMTGANDERRVFVTGQGMVGNGHRDIEVGDVVAVFRGCPYPLVLRPAGEIGVFKLVSHAWVSGLMEAQAWEGEVNEELSIVE